MFAQKILSLVSILLLGSLTTVKADIAACPQGFNPAICNGSLTHDSYCVLGLEVYSITDGNACVENVLTLTANTVNVIDTNSSELADTGTGIADLVTANNIALVDCGASSCSQTFGYFKSTEVPSAYYRIGADGTNQVVVTVGDCSENIGSLFTDNKLCITDSVKVDFGTDANYLIEDDTGVFTSAGDGTNVVVASRTNSITTVNIGENSYLVTDKAGLLNGNAENVLVVKLNANGDGTIVVDDEFDGQDFCVDKNWAIYERTDGLCEAVVDGEDCTHYYDCTAGKSCTVNDSNRNPNAACVPTDHTKCADGYYLVDGNELSTESGALWQCFGKNGENCQNIDSNPQIGFLVNAGSDNTNTKYIQCTGTSTGSCSIAPIGNDCVATETYGKATYGQLYKENLGSSYELCLYDGEKKSITIGESKKYLIEKKADTMLGFTKDENVATKYVVLEVDASQNILPVARTAVGYYSTASATSYEVVTVPTVGVTLYSCAADTNGLKCGQVSSKPIGYLKNQDDTGSAIYIYCPKSGTCDAIAVTGTSCEATDSGTAVTTGYLYNTDNFCVYNSGDKSIKLIGANKGMYFVSAATSLFELTRNDDSFIVVKLDEQGNLTVVKELEGNSVRYRYTLSTDTKNKIHTRAQAKTETDSGYICGPGGTPKEFTLIQWTSSIDVDKENADYYIATPASQ